MSIRDDRGWLWLSGQTFPAANKKGYQFHCKVLFISILCESILTELFFLGFAIYCDQQKVTFMTVSAVNPSFQCPAICRVFEREPCSHFYLLNIRFVLDSLKNIEQRNKLYANCLALRLPSGKMFTHLYIQNLGSSSQHLGCFLILHCSSFHIVGESKT